MTYSVSWDEEALDQAVGFLKNDPVGVAAVLAACDALQLEPRPRGSTSLGSRERFRIHVGPYHLWYDIDDDEATVRITRCGKVI
jgi:mRNA interferase RelE/StbE